MPPYLLPFICSFFVLSVFSFGVSLCSFLAFPLFLTQASLSGFQRSYRHYLEVMAKHFSKRIRCCHFESSTTIYQIKAEVDNSGDPPPPTPHSFQAALESHFPRSHEHAVLEDKSTRVKMEWGIPRHFLKVHVICDNFLYM